jgi:glycolate oxidase
MKDVFLQELRKQLSNPDSLIADPADLDDYTHDETAYHQIPVAVLMAETRDDIVAAARLCHKHRIPITTRGAGTGLSGGCVPSQGSLVISTMQMDKLEIYPQDRVAICGPGVITKDLQDQAAGFGLTYPPDPASYAESSLGGNVAEGAGGLRCKRFGVTKDYVIGLEAVTAGGEVIRSGVLSGTRGFSFGDVLVASEGTLAIITEIAVNLIPLPGRGTTILAAFDHPKDAAATVSQITTSGIVPTVLEYIDGDTVKLANEYAKSGEIDNAAAVLLIETSDVGIEKQKAQIEEICRRNASSFLRSEPDPDKAEQLWAIRRDISKAAAAAAKVKISEDVAVPNSKFPTLVEFVAEMNRTSPLRINSYGHAGDGNLHVNFLSMSGEKSEQALIDRAIEDLMRKTVELGGTLSGEHGIGMAKRQYMTLEFDPPTLAAMRSFKAIFDPENCLNPGKIFPDQK